MRCHISQHIPSILHQTKILILFFALFSHKVLAICSPYWGEATINEAGKVGFVEIKLLLTSIPQSEYQNWQVRSCYPQGRSINCSSFMAIGSAPLENNAYLRVFTSSIPNNRPFDIILVDGNGNTIDYLSVGNFLYQQDSSCTPYYDWTAPLVNSSHDFIRKPDGTGEWGDAGSGNSGGDTGGGTNDDNFPIISVADISLPKGNLATFTLTIPSAETFDVSVDFLTVDNSAFAGTHYTASSGTATISAGNTSVNVSINTTANSPGGEVSFYLFLSGAVNGTPANHYPAATLLQASLDHIEISHDGSALSCSPETITLKACENASCTIVATTPVVVTLSSTSTNSSWSQNPVTIPANSTAGVTVELTNPTPETVTLSATSSPAADNLVVCTPSCSLSFSESGFVLTLADHNSCSTPTLTIQALQSAPGSMSCAPAYTGNQSVGFSYQYLNPATGTIIPQISSLNLAATPSTIQNRTITFDANASASLPFQYNDAGQLNITVTDSGNNGLTDGSVQPVSRPAQFIVEATETNADCVSGDANCSIFKTAGESFNLRVSAACADPSIITPNFIGQVNLSVNTVSPALGNPVTLAVNNIQFSNTSPQLDNGVHTEPNQSISEVGVFNIIAAADNYFAQDLPLSTSANIGRFIPDHFVIANNAILEQCGTFTYAGFDDGINLGLNRSGQPFTIAGTITAENSAGNTTLNYNGAFAKLVSSDIQVQPYNTDTAANDIGNINFSPAALIFNNGVTAYSAANSHYQIESERAEFNLRLDLTATDSDSVSGTESSNSFEIRLGRFILQDSYGPETEPQEMPVLAEYYNGTGWQLNSADSCTTYDTSRVSFDTTSYTDNLVDGETAATAPATVTQLMSGISMPSDGLWFSAPGLNNYGSVLVDFDLTDQGWLRFDWDQDLTIESISSAQLNFGYYRGSDRVIYWQEQ